MEDKEVFIKGDKNETVYTIVSSVIIAGESSWIVRSVNWRWDNGQGAHK
jgi:hypothetical protein